MTKDGKYFANIKENKLHEGTDMLVELTEEKLDGKIQQLFEKTMM